MLNDFEIKNGILVKYHGSNTRVVIPDRVTVIGAEAFRECSSLASIVIPDNVTKIELGAFADCTNLTSIVIPDSVTEIGCGAFCRCSSLTSIVISDNVTKIELGAFTDCTNLTSIVIPDSVTEIGGGAFDGCSSLTSIVIPDSVTEIGGGAFDGCSSLMSIVIPDSVTIIGRDAFWGCSSLMSIIIPDSVTEIGFCAFWGCSSLTSIVIPDSVTEIGKEAFENCPKITIICRESSYAHRYCVSNCFNYIFDYQYEVFHGVLPPGIEKLQSPFLADEEKPYIFVSYSHEDRNEVLGIIKELYEAGWRIWYDEGLTIGDRYDETLKEHVRNCAAFLLFVTERSVNSSYIRKNEIPWAEKYKKPVVKCILDAGTDITVKEDSVAAVVGRNEIEPTLNMLGGLTRGERREAKGISVIVDPANKSGANGGGFAYCLYAKERAATAKAILLEAKKGGCVLYDAVENSEDDEKLKSCACLIVVIDKAFLSDARLTKILIEAYQAKKDIAVCQLEDLADEDLPQELLELHKTQWLNFVHGLAGDVHTKLARYLQERGCRNTAVLPGLEYEVTEEGIVITRYTGVDPEPRLESEYGGVPVRKIDKEAFRNCIHLERLAIPFGIAEIGENAFEGCASLTSIVIPYSVTYIGESAFSRCSNLTSIVIPDSVTKIGRDAFKCCSNLTSIVIPDSVTEIKRSAFRSCSSLTKIVIPNSVTKIGICAFEGCSSLAKIVIPNSVKEIGGRAFCGCSSLTSIVIPNSVTVIGGNAFKGCSSLTSIVISDSVTIISESSFEGCSSLMSIVIPDSVTEIGKWAFEGCSSLTSIFIQDNVTEIGEDAFIGCDHLNVICSPGSKAWEYCKEHDIPVRAYDEPLPATKETSKTSLDPDKPKSARPGFFNRLFGRK